MPFYNILYSRQKMVKIHNCSGNNAKRFRNRKFDSVVHTVPDHHFHCQWKMADVVGNRHLKYKSRIFAIWNFRFNALSEI